MIDGFDWKIRDDFSEWKPGKQAPERSPQPSRKKWGRWIWGITAVLLLTCLAGAIAYSQLNRKAAAVTNDLSQDVIAVHQLVLETAVTNDIDLFKSSFLNPDSQWSKSQFELVARDLYLNRAPLSLWVDATQLISQTISTPNTTTTFSPDLQRVEILVEQPYLTRTSDNEIAPIVLVNTAVYQKQDNVWLLAAPDDTFWGSSLEAESSIITMHFPARDAEIAQKLTADLNNLLVSACEQEIFPCAQDLIVDMQLKKDVNSLLGLNRRFYLASRYSPKFGRRYSISLPTPTLVGLPVDDAGYEALYRGYGAQLLGAMIVNLHPNYAQLTPEQNFLQRQFAELDLDMPDPAGFHPAETAVPPPIPFPDYDIVAYCEENGGYLQHYDLQTETWHSFYLDGFIYALTALENRDGALITVHTDTGREIQWWQPDHQRTLIEAQNAYVNSAFLYPNEDNPDKHVINFFSGPESIPSWKLLDENNCSDDNCELEDISEWPLVSPNGRFNLIISLARDGWTREIYLEDVANGERTSYGHGFSPVWMDDETFAFIRVANLTSDIYPTETTLRIVNLAQTADNITEITVKDIWEPIIGGNVDYYVDNFMIGGLLKRADENWLIMLYRAEPNQYSLSYLVEYITETGRMIPMNIQEFNTAVFLGSSPDNRYFSIAGLEQSGVVMRLYDAQQYHYRSYAVPSAWRGRYDWTPDSQWLLILEEDGIRLLAPEHDYERRIVHAFGGCITAVWVNGR